MIYDHLMIYHHLAHLWHVNISLTNYLQIYIMFSNWYFINNETILNDF